MHVLIVSIGCVITPARSAPLSAPAASAIFFSMPESWTSRSWMSGVTPSIDMVNIASLRCGGARLGGGGGRRWWLWR